jgi:hypothetical protein
MTRNRIHPPSAVISLFVLACGAAGPEAEEATGPVADPTLEGDGLPRCTADSPVGLPCVDETGARLCPRESGYPGDGLALCELDTGSEGINLHYGPSDYDDPEAVAPFLLGPGGEEENCTFAYTSNTEDRYISAYHGRLRPQSHHLIVTTLIDEGIDASANPVPCTPAGAVGSRWLLGSQDPQIDVLIAGGLTVSEEDNTPRPGDPDYGLAQLVSARTPVRINVHYVNATSETILREAWVGLTYAEEEDVVDLVDMITFFQGSISVPPLGSVTTERASCVANTDRYVGLVTGHAHQTLTRFSVWHEQEGGASDLIYETYDYADPGNVYYRDGIVNQPPDPASGRFGGSSGYRFVKAGEAVSFECEYKNPSDRTITLGFTGDDEMCNVFGMYYPSDGNVWNCACAGSSCSGR